MESAPTLLQPAIGPRMSLVVPLLLCLGLAVPMAAVSPSARAHSPKDAAGGSESTDGGESKSAAVVSPLPFEIGGPFSLVDHTGRRWTDEDFHGVYLIVYFGYTSCPNTCSTAMLNLGLAVDELGEDGKLVRPLFVSVDPDYDTPARLAAYVARFHPRFLGLTGSVEEINAVLGAYRSNVRKVEDSGAYDRLFEHNPIAYLVGSDGQVATLLPPVLPPQRMAEIIRGYVKP